MTIRMRWSRGAALVTAVALAAGALAACGDDDDDKKGREDATGSQLETTTSEESAEPYNTDTLEKTLVSNLAGGGATDGPKITEVQCPDSTQPAAGETVECDATGDGLSGTVAVTFEDDSGAAYAYKAELEGEGGLTQTVEGTVTGK